MAERVIRPLHEVIRKAVIIEIRADTANQGHMVHLLSRMRQQLGDVNARNRRRNRLERPPVSRSVLGSHDSN